jgi:3-isopropylmalate/(R)-2-methylmalate dehydratase large subunit
MTPQTLGEKLLSRAAGRCVRAGDLAVCRPDLALGTDASIPMALECLGRLDGGVPRAPYDARRLVFALDHFNASSDPLAVARQDAARGYAALHGITLFEVDQGIAHQCVLETGRALPGQVALGADSHAVSYGALNAFATGIGASDLAGVMYCGQVWLRVPASIRVELTGKLPAGVSAKDLALTLVSRLGADGASYSALEYGGPGVAALDMDDRIVLANMSVETGAKAGLFRCDIKTRAYLARSIGARTAAAQVAETPDPGARYAEMIAIDLGKVEAMVALPDRFRQVVPLAVTPPTHIDMVYLGSCSGGRVKDYRQALDVLRDGGGVGPGIRLVVTPASERVRSEMEELGMLAEFERLGAEIFPPGCGACSGTCAGAPVGRSRVASTANRNFEGRMGNADAQIYLASPAECARAAVTGRLGGPGSENGL